MSPEEMGIMNIGYFGEKIFYDEIRNAGQIWVARSAYKNIHYMEFDRTGISLPVWSSSKRVEDYLNNARLIGPKYEPSAVSLDTFTNAWLSDKMMAITELLINPDGKVSRMLALYPEEFVESQAS
jgi:hypothetical protein